MNIVKQKRELSAKHRSALSAYLKLHNVTLSWLCRRRKQPYAIWNSRINNGLCHKNDVMTIAKWINKDVKLVESHGLLMLVDTDE
jgi:hypothetical protein